MSSSSLALPADKARQMRRVAGGLLLAMAALFLFARSMLDTHPAWGFVLAFAEAAMVGGLADWFAVTALFRRPLGLPIPHTAIIPTNKDRIADTMGEFLRSNFLTPTVIARRMQDMNVARAIGRYLSQSGGADQSRIGAGAAALLADILESLDQEQLGGEVRAGLTRQLERMEISPLLGRMLQTAIADKRHMPLIDALIRQAGVALEANEGMVRAMIHERANALLRWTGVDERIANSVLDGLYRLLAEMLVEPDHPLRLKLDEGLEDLAERLISDPALRERVEQTKRELLANPALAEWWLGVWERIRIGIISAARDPDRLMSGQLGEAISDLGAQLSTNAALQGQVNRFLRRTAVGLAARYGGQIVRLVSDTVKRWDADTVTQRIEGAVGRDLQFIRINGTLVGGLVGVTIHLVDVLLG